MRRSPHSRRQVLRWTPRKQRRLLYLTTTLVSISATRSVLANPEGMSVVSGSASSQTTGNALNLQVGQHTFLDWRSFNIKPGEITTFLQPSLQSVVINRINDQNPSEIWGSLKANGTVILANRNGFYFGPNSSIQVGSFIATTAPIGPDAGSGGFWQFSGMAPQVSIENHGEIRTKDGGSLFLIADKVENYGTLSAPQGHVGLYAGKEVLLSNRPDGLGVSTSVKLPSGSVDNRGLVIADAGTIAIAAQAVNQNGIIQANSVREKNGVIELVASESVALGSDSRLVAKGDGAGISSGGSITVRSDAKFADSQGSSIDATGGLGGGDGGHVELSASTFQSLHSTLDAKASAGFKGGSLLLDPQDIVLSTAGSGDPGNGVITSDSNPGRLELDVNSAFLNRNFASITLQATRDITLATGTQWNLSQSTGSDSAGHLLTLQAGNNIVFGNNSRLIDANNWSVRLEAGVNFSLGSVQSGVGSILLNGGTGVNGTGSIETTRGDITMTAGKDILVAGGFIRTVGGGNINLRALGGDIDAGRKNDGYEFFSGGYRISLAGLGGIATAKGGDVILAAGRDVLSTPSPGVGQPPGASGAYGSEHGDVTISAGRVISGNFLVRNGQGTLKAGVTVENGVVNAVLNPLADVGLNNKPVSLSLVTGSWDVFAARDIFISEVRNPNGTFNRNKLAVPGNTYAGNQEGDLQILPPDRQAFLFDYAPDSSASFIAGHGITLVGANLPRVTGQNQTMKAVYPAQLRLEAGSGGIDIQNSLTLFPSAQGSLTIITHDGGNLSGRQQQSVLAGITMSDSGLPDYATFNQGHAIAPLHANSDHKAIVNIDGEVSNFALTVPTAARVTIKKGTYNFGFLGQHVKPGSETKIEVGEDIRYRGNLTDVPLNDPFAPEILDIHRSGGPTIVNKLRYDPITHKLTFIGPMTLAELTFLLNPTLIIINPEDGLPLLDGNGNPQTEPVAISGAQQAALRQLYDASQSASLVDNGLIVSGPGRFIVSARNMDLGISQGLVARAPSLPLQNISTARTDIQVSLAGDLDMTSTKISNESYLGGIQISAGGKIDVGSQTTALGEVGIPKGIFTTSGGDVDVTAGQDLNVNGSRIATYNGGNIKLKSDLGDINAGSGGAGFVSFASVSLDATTGLLKTDFATIPGSGLLATTLPTSTAKLGNITAEATAGSIRANLGGIIQIAFNGQDSRSSVIDLKAGKDIDAGGSGIIGSAIRLKAGGNINGIVIGSQRIDIAADRNVNVSAISGGSVSINAGATVSGTVVGGSSVSVSGEAISAALASHSVSASGDTSGASIGVPASNASKSEAKVAEDTGSAINRGRAERLEDDEAQRKKLASAPVLARSVGRVTVILPQK